MATKWPSVAYHFHKDDEITIADAIKMRDEGDTRAGDIWCHAECYKAELRTGNRLFPVNRQSNPYFRRGKSSYTRKVECEYERVMLSKGESYRFAQFYHDLLVWLNSSTGEVTPHDLFHILRVEESKTNEADIVLSHTKNAPIDWIETRIIIVDKNRKRRAINEHTLMIDITHWTDSQLADFRNSGVRKMKDEWGQLLAKEAERVQYEANMARDEKKANTKYSMKKARDAKWINSNRSFILQARALSHHCEKKYNQADRKRMKLQHRVKEGDVSPLTQLEIDNCIREMNNYSSYNSSYCDVKLISMARWIKDCNGEGKGVLGISIKEIEKMTDKYVD